VDDAAPRVTVVVPTYNERPNLEELAARGAGQDLEVVPVRTRLDILRLPRPRPTP